MKRTSTILITSSLVLFFAGSAHAQTATKSEPPPLPPPATAASSPSTGAPLAPAPASPQLPAPAAEPPTDASPATPVPSAPDATTPVAPSIDLRDDASPASPIDAESSPTKNAPHAGFSLTMSVGYSVPAGAATGAASDDMSNFFSGQVPLGVEIGGNATPSLFIGLYGQFAIGGVGGTTDTSCTKNQVNCSAHTFRGGLALRYRFLPGSSVRPWLGYAIGYAVSTVSLSSDYVADTASISLSGWELGHFSGGVDFMTAENHAAIGPYLDVGLGEYSHVHEEGTRSVTQDVDITDTALHEWITIGIRATFMP